MRKRILNEGWFDYIPELNEKKKKKKKKGSSSRVSIFPNYNVNLFNRHLGWSFDPTKYQVTGDSSNAKNDNETVDDIIGDIVDTSSSNESSIEGESGETFVGDIAIGDGDSSMSVSAGDGGASGEGGASAGGGMGESFIYHLDEGLFDTDIQNELLEKKSEESFEYIGRTDYEQMICHSDSKDETANLILKWKHSHPEEPVSLVKYDPIQDVSTVIYRFE